VTNEYLHGFFSDNLSWLENLWCIISIIILFDSCLKPQLKNYNLWKMQQNAIHFIIILVHPNTKYWNSSNLSSTLNHILSLFLSTTSDWIMWKGKKFEVVYFNGKDKSSLFRFVLERSYKLPSISVVCALQYMYLVIYLWQNFY
jgi:hypothetical protein